MTITVGYVDNFIQNLTVNEKSATCNDVAVLLLTSESECNEFYTTYYRTNRYLIDDLLDYREDKIKSNLSIINIENFISMCNNDMKNAFENVFIQRFTDEDIKIVNQRLLNGGVTLSLIFDKFSANTNENMMRFICH